MNRRRHDPPDDAPAALFTPGFWVALAFGLALVLAGVGTALYGPRLFPIAKPSPTAPSPGPAGRRQARFDSGNGAWQGSRPHRI